MEINQYQFFFSQKKSFSSTSQDQGTLKSKSENVQSDNVALSSLTLDDAQKVLYGRLDENIRNVLSVEDVVPSLQPSDWTPEAVAGRILNFAQQFLKATDTAEKYNSVLAEVEKGIKAGLDQAKDTLESFQMLNGTIAENVSATESLLYQGIDHFKSMTSQLFTSGSKLEA